MISRPHSAAVTVQRTSNPSGPASKPPCTIHPSAVIADKAQIIGSHLVEIGENVVLHPYTKIKAEGGSVKIGKGSVVWENAVVGGDSDVAIGEYVTIESGAVVEAKSVGEGSVVDVKAVVGKGAIVGKWCKICPLEKVEAGEEVKDYDVVYGDGQRATDVKTLKEHDEVRRARVEGMDKGVDILRKLVGDAKAKFITP